MEGNKGFDYCSYEMRCDIPGSGRPWVMGFELRKWDVPTNRSKGGMMQKSTPFRCFLEFSYMGIVSVC